MKLLGRQACDSPSFFRVKAIMRAAQRSRFVRENAILSKLFALYFEVADIEDEYQNREVVSTSFDDMLAFHLRVLYYLQRRDYEDAFAAQLAVGIFL